MIPMNKESSVHEIHTELQMRRTTDSRTFILLEGESDCRIINNHLDEGEACTVPVYGRKKVEGAIQLLNSAGMLAVVGIVDADLSHATADQPDTANLFLTDMHDLDAEIFFTTDALDLFMQHHSCDVSPPQHKSHGSISAHEILRDLVAPIGALRLISKQDRLGISLSSLDLGQIIDPVTAVLNQQTLIRLVCQKNPNLDQPDLEMKLANVLLSPPIALERLCRGHDLAKAFALINRGGRGKRFSQGMVEDSLRLAMSKNCTSFSSLSFFTRIGEWAACRSRRVWHEACSADSAAG
jgi:hypothetical protein